MAKRILLGFAEALPAPEAIFSLRRAGHEVTLVHRRNNGGPVLGLAGAAHAITPPEQSVERAVSDLGDLLRGGGFDALFAIDDVSLWLANRVDAGAVAQVHATGRQAEVALDKRLQFEAAERAGLAVPRSSHEGHAAEIAPPAIVKPALAVTRAGDRLIKGGVRYLHGSAALAGEAHADREAADETPMVTQPLLSGQGEGVFGFATESGVTAWSGHRRLRMLNPHGSGSSACISTEPDPDICARVGAMMSEIGWRGPFMAEFLRDAGGTLWFMELNGRLWGSLALARRLGMDHPAWAVAQCFDPGFVPEAPPARAGVEMRHLGRELLHPLYVLRGPRSAFHRRGWPRFWPALRRAWAPARAECFYNHDPSAPRFFIRDALHDIRKRVLR